MSGGRDQFEQEVLEMTFVHSHPELTSRPVTELSTYFHLGRQSNDGDPDFVSDAGFESFVNVPWVTGGEGTKDDEDLSGGVGWKVAACLI